MPAPILPLVEIAPLLPARGTLIGLDLGTKTIGVAASDPDRRLNYDAILPFTRDLPASRLH